MEGSGSHSQVMSQPFLGRGLTENITAVGRV
jgi:hypothetical protein